MSTSNTNNCIIFNSILFNSESNINSFINPLTSPFGKLREFNSHAKINSNYHYRAEKIVTLIKERKGHTTQTWDYYYEKYAKGIIDSVVAEQYTEATKKMQIMVSECEVEFGIVTAAGGIYINSYIPFSETNLQNINIDDRLLVLNNSLNETEETIVAGYMNSIRSLVTLVSSSGIRLTCADMTPMTLEFGDTLVASNCKGRNIPVMDNNIFRWESCIDVIPCGLGEVVNILTTNPVCYAAGDEKNRWIWTQRIPK